jgi:hypothetical protein
MENEHTLFDGKHFSHAQATCSLWGAKHTLATVVRFDITSAKWTRICLRLAAQRGMPSTTGCQPKLVPLILLECVNKRAADARTREVVVTIGNYSNTMTTVTNEAGGSDTRGTIEIRWPR